MLNISDLVPPLGPFSIQGQCHHLVAQSRDYSARLTNELTDRAERHILYTPVEVSGQSLSLLVSSNSKYKYKSFNYHCVLKHVL